MLCGETVVSVSPAIRGPMKSRNKIVAGQYKEFRFKEKYGQLYLGCLEKELSINSMTIKSLEQIDSIVVPSTTDMILKGAIGNYLLGLLGILVGTSVAKKKCIYKMKIRFWNDEIGIAEIDEKIYEMLLDIVI